MIGMKSAHGCGNIEGEKYDQCRISLYFTETIPERAGIKKAGKTIYKDHQNKNGRKKREKKDA